MPTLQRTALTTRQTVLELKQDNSDFEWYPTTSEMIDEIRSDLIKKGYARFGDNSQLGLSVLDVGAGDGRVLRKLTNGSRYAIEKSEVHLKNIKADTFIVGTDFEQQTIMDKKVDMVFSNMPYSCFEGWAEKLIKEANAQVVYLIMPSRWTRSKKIADAIEARQGKANVIYNGDFLDAERKARAEVEIVCITLAYERYLGAYNRVGPKTDPFDIWFDEHFYISASKMQASVSSQNMKHDSESLLTPENQQLIKQEGLVKVLQRFYECDLNKLLDTYKKIEELDSHLLGELGVSVNNVKGSLKGRISGLKDLYWRELFNRLTTITDRLTSSSREAMLNKLMENTSVDFSAENAHAIILWVVKNANNYFDAQLVDVMESMVNHGNIALYKSNKRTFGDEEWRYGCKPVLEKYGLDYRIVLHNKGGIDTGYFGDEVRGLSSRAQTFLDDVLTIARNVGFDTVGMLKAGEGERLWDSGKKQLFQYRCTSTNEIKTLFEAKAFYNGNLHVRFNQAFICALNCEFGRLKGWLKSREQASEELDIPLSKTTHFGINTKLVSAAVLPLLNHVA